MRLKKLGALILSAVMMTGTIGMMSPAQVKAATPANTYTMTVPADMEIQNSGWNSLGEITVSKVSSPIDTGKKITVTATTANDFALVNGANSVSYTMKTAESDTAAKTAFDFDAAAVNAEGGASQAVGVDVEDFAGKPAGTYEDTITFTGTMSNAGGSEEKGPEDILTCDELQIKFSMNGSMVTYESAFTRDGSTYTCTKCEEFDGFGHSNEVDYAEICSGSIGGEDDTLFMMTLGDFALTIDTKNKTYEYIDTDTGMGASFFDKGGTQIIADGVDITDQLTDITVRSGDAGDVLTCSHLVIKFEFLGDLYVATFVKDGPGFVCDSCRYYGTDGDMIGNVTGLCSATIDNAALTMSVGSYSIVIDTENQTYEFKHSDFGRDIKIITNGIDLTDKFTDITVREN